MLASTLVACMGAGPAGMRASRAKTTGNCWRARGLELLRELQARLRSLLRRREKPLLTRLEAGDLVLDPNARTATVGGQPLRLTAKELALVEYLLTRVDEVVTRTEISEHVWDDSFDSLSNVVDVTVYRLRKKIDGDRSERLLHTVKGVGYLLSSHRREGDPT